MKTKIWTIMLVLSLCLASWQVAPVSGYDSGVVVQTLLKSKMTSGGQPIEYPRTDRAEVTAAIVEIKPGAETGWHLHKIPVYAYVLEGTLHVQLNDGKENRFEKGQVIIEVFNLAHIGRNKGKETVKLLVFYTGEEGSPNAIKISR